MREVRARRFMPLMLSFAVVLWACAGQAAQTGSPLPGAVPALGWQVLTPLLSFRRGWIDSTRVDACAIYRGMGNPADFPAGLPAALRPLLGTWGATPCEPVPGSSTSPLDRYVVKRVRFDSIAGDDRVRHVYFTVQRGEYVHHEEYTMRALSATASTVRTATPATASWSATPPRASAPILYATSHANFAPPGYLLGWSHEQMQQPGYQCDG